MCQSGINQSVVKRNDTPRALVDRNDITHAEKVIPGDSNPLITPPSLIYTSQGVRFRTKQVASEQKTPGSLFIQQLLEGLLASATGSTPRPSDVCEELKSAARSPPRLSDKMLPNNVHELCSSSIGDANNISIEAQAASSSGTDSSDSDSDSDDDTKVLAAVCEESDTDHRKETSLRTKHEKDENNVFISRPEFVATEQHTLVKVGTISGILDNAVIVTTFNLTDLHPRLPSADITTATALDTGSLLCFPDGNLLGAVFETFGPVSSPLYVVRFNTADEIPSATQVGQEIMYVEQEMRVVRARDVCRKGYDASGRDDEEVDAEEFSDDEKERRAKKLKRSGNTDRAAGPLKRKRGPRETQRQRRTERPPFRTRAEFGSSARFCPDEHERHWATPRGSWDPHGSNQQNMRRFQAAEHLSPRARTSIQTPAAPSPPNFITEGAAFMPTRYPADVLVDAPSMTNLPGTRNSSFNSHVTNTAYPVSLQPSPFSAPIAPFSDHLMGMPHQQGYTQYWGPHASYNQYVPNSHANPPQQPYGGDIGQPASLYAAGPSHPYRNYEYQPSGAPNRDRTGEQQHRGSIPNPNIDAEGWQRASRQYHHM